MENQTLNTVVKTVLFHGYSCTSHTKSMDASINPILAITVVVIPASVTLHEGFEHAVLDAISVVGLIRPPVGVLSYRVAFVPTKFS